LRNHDHPPVLNAEYAIFGLPHILDKITITALLASKSDLTNSPTMAPTTSKPASFATLPRELRQAILLEAVQFEVNKAIRIECLRYALEHLESKGKDHMRARRYLLAVYEITSRLKPVLPDP
jgi:hypothetical protein